MRVLKLLRRFWARKWLRWMMILGVFFTVASVGGMYASSQNAFCNSCHSMNSYYDTWQASKHVDVDCVQCHIAPGMGNLVHAKLNGMGQLVDTVLGRGGLKPSASVSNESCLRSGCHVLEEVLETNKTEGAFLFKHKGHVDLDYLGITVKCSSCHSHVKGDEHFNINRNACIACHLLKPRTAVERAVNGHGNGSASSRPAIMPVASMPIGRPISQPPEFASGLGRSSATGPAGGMSVITTQPVLKGAPAQCKSCHNPPDKPIKYQGLDVVHKDYVAYGAACESCHHRATAPADKVTDAHCLTCHEYGLERKGSVEETHRQHYSGEYKVECFSCHGVVSHGPAAQAMRLNQVDCRACHLGQHTIQQATYKVRLPAGTGAVTSQSTTTQSTTTQSTTTRSAVELAVTPMFLAHVDCTGCHVKPRALRAKPGSGAVVAAASSKACDRCHQKGLGDQMVPMWQRNARDLYRIVEAKFKPLEGDKDPHVVELVGEARKMLDVVRLDGSWGVHNPLYTQKLLNEARQRLVDAAAVSATMPGKGTDRNE